MRELLPKATPQASRVAVMAYDQSLPPPYSFGQWDALEAAAPALRVTLRLHLVKTLEDMERAFAAMKKERAEALVVLSAPSCTPTPSGS